MVISISRNLKLFTCSTSAPLMLSGVWVFVSFFQKSTISSLVLLKLSNRLLSVHHSAGLLITSKYKLIMQPVCVHACMCVHTHLLFCFVLHSFTAQASVQHLLASTCKINDRCDQEPRGEALFKILSYESFISDQVGVSHLLIWHPFSLFSMPAPCSALCKSGVSIMMDLIWIVKL